MAISRSSILNLFQRPLTAVIGIGVLTLATVGVKARVWRNSWPAITKQEQLLPTIPGPAQIVRFTVYDAGIFPSEARAGAGLVDLHMEDMSGGSEGLVLISESREALMQIIRSPGRGRGRGRIALGPGRYAVYDPSRPMNQSTLIIEP